MRKSEPTVASDNPALSIGWSLFRIARTSMSKTTTKRARATARRQTVDW